MATFAQQLSMINININMYALSYSSCFYFKLYCFIFTFTLKEKYIKIIFIDITAILFCAFNKNNL